MLASIVMLDGKSVIFSIVLDRIAANPKNRSRQRLPVVRAVALAAAII
jgi:hypothetical protein